MGFEGLLSALRGGRSARQANLQGAKSHKWLPFAAHGLLYNETRLFATVVYKQDGNAQHGASVTFRLLPGSHEFNAG